GSVILTDPDSSSEIASFKIHQIIFCCRGKQDSQEASCFAYTCSHGKTVETSIFQCHVFDCHSPEHVGNVLLSFASAFSRVTSRNTSTLDSNELNKNMNMSTPMLMKSSDEMYVFEVFLEIREDDYRGGYIAVPWDKSYFKLRCDVDKKLSLVVQQVGGSERLFIEKCFGLLLCPGRNVKHSDMQLLELSSMGTSNESDRMYVISGGWDPTDPIYEVLNTETPKDTKVFFTVAVDLVIRGIEEPVRFSLETKAKIFPRTERFWYFSKKFMQEKFQMKLRRVFSTGTQLNDLTSDKFKFEVFNVESESDMERKRKVLTLNLTAAGARAAVQSVQTPADADTDSDRDEPLLSGSGVVSKDCSEGELEGWADVLSKWRQNLRQRPKQLSSLVRKGIPEALRGEVWQLLARCDEDSKDMMEMYRILITKESSCESTIMRDIHRTFPAHEFFRENGGLGQDSLYKISKAYSVYDEEVGYCQGLSFLAAALVLHMPEEQAFCLQVKIMFQYQLRDLFKQGFDELHLKFYQLERLLEDQLPELYDHFVELGIEAHMYGSQWFLTLYTAKFPLCLVYFILDLFLLEGTDTIFRVALALLLMSKEDLLALDFEGILKYFRVSLPKKYRTEESAKQLVNSAVKIKVKKLKKYEKEYAIIKEQENLQQDPVERL
ncbi:RABGAP1 (predicted), partial [Pycnogonum litorale]